MATATLALPNPLPIQALGGDTPISYGGQDLRWLIGAMYHRTGRIGFADTMWLYPRLAGADWSVDVNAGMCIVGVNAATSYAPERYLVTLAARTNIPLTGFVTAPAATRSHGVWVVVKDASQTGAGAGYGASIVVTEDTGAGAPNPTGSFFLRLGTVTIAPAQSNIGTANLSVSLQRGARGTPVTALNYASGFATFVSGTIGQAVSYSVDGNTVRLQGTVYRTAGNLIAGTIYTVGTLPSSAAPKYARQAIILGGGPWPLRCLAATSGDIQITAITNDATYASLDNFSFEIF